MHVAKITVPAASRRKQIVIKWEKTDNDDTKTLQQKKTNIENPQISYMSKTLRPALIMSSSSGHLAAVVPLSFPLACHWARLIPHSVTFPVGVKI